MPPVEPGFLPRERLQDLLDALHATGRRVLGPRERDGAVLFDDLRHVAELPRGVRVHQAPGEYRVQAGDDERLFAWSNGPQALKPLLFAPRETLWHSRRDARGRLEFRQATPDIRPLAVIGVRACDLAALALTDQHFLHGPHPDAHYAERREGLLLVAVNCSDPSATCFCASTGDGPHVREGADLTLTELDDGFLVHAGSDAGAELAAALDLRGASAAQREAESAQERDARKRQSRSLPGRNLRAALFGNLHSPRWEQVAARCLSCGNCTSVCPTCFCHAQMDVPALGGEQSEHVREWDSCFTQRHCEMHGYRVRPHIRQRYRQWLSHKLGSWHDQYGRSGCVGCGRCVAWCPVGIDITEEARAVCGDAPQ